MVNAEVKTATRLSLFEKSAIVLYPFYLICVIKG
ncbi:hypothetical protein EZMO1_3641 [Endozoicomonas montiporae CL-33]|uniref:Uncharacterized protein n=1 Tax=Endozoicomonas montiporae CL-33 TaxID=570277 RepID=A0A142BFU4_9GAMM|nr:hypothetical protein EZMO1_3641 [Endozoicomonas montiporae CL-33]